MLHSQQWSQILAQNRDFCLSHLHSTPPFRGFPSEYCHAVWCGKTRMVWLPDGEIILKISLFILTECTNVTDTHTPHDSIGRACIASHGKNCVQCVCSPMLLSMKCCDYVPTRSPSAVCLGSEWWTHWTHVTYCKTIIVTILLLYCKLWTQAVASKSTSKFSQFFYTTNRLPVPL